MFLSFNNASDEVYFMSNVLFKPSAFRKYIVFLGLHFGQYDNIRDSYVYSEISSLYFSIESVDVGSVSMTSRHCIPTINNRNNASKQAAFELWHRRGISWWHSKG